MARNAKARENVPEALKPELQDAKAQLDSWRVERDAPCRATRSVPGFGCGAKSVGRRTAVRQGQLAAPVLWAVAAPAIPSKASTRMLSLGGAKTQSVCPSSRAV